MFCSFMLNIVYVFVYNYALFVFVCMLSCSSFLFSIVIFYFGVAHVLFHTLNVLILIKHQTLKNEKTTNHKHNLYTHKNRINKSILNIIKQENI